MSHLPLWYIKELDLEQCNRVVSELTVTESKEATTGLEGILADLNTRKTIVRFAEDGYWLTNILEQAALEANKQCGWEYHITSKEQVQFAEYSENNHYTWHTDTFSLSGKPIDRKITVVCLLNNEFEGGEFDIRLYSDYEAPLKKGTIIVFPSILEHRVRPITKGVRYSATVWFNGPRFR